MNYGMNYGVRETLFQALGKEWNRRETADKPAWWGGTERESWDRTAEV